MLEYEMHKLVLVAMLLVSKGANCLKCMDEATSGELLALSEMYFNCIPDVSQESANSELMSSEVETSTPMSFFESLSRQKRFVDSGFQMDNDLPSDNRDLEKTLGLHDWGCVFHCMMGQQGLINPRDNKPDPKFMARYISTMNDTEMRDFVFVSSHKCFEIINRGQEKCDYTMDLVECMWTRLGANCE